jgi:protein TonB
MHALEEAPDEQGRYRRMGLGVGAVALLGVGLMLAAEHVTPMRKLRDSVIQMAVVARPEEPPPLPPLPPPPPPPRELAKPKPKQAKAAPTPQEPSKTPPAPAEEQVGLDDSSFGEGAGGPAFHVGTTQMGTPTGGPLGGGAEPERATTPVVPAAMEEARPVKGNPAPIYTDAARKANVEGLIVIEVSIDERGRVLTARVRSGLHPELDAGVRKTIERWSFVPATLAGRSIASTKFLRIRFDLQ